jgi:hypothetical protein
LKEFKTLNSKYKLLKDDLVCFHLYSIHTFVIAAFSFYVTFSNDFFVYVVVLPNCEEQSLGRALHKLVFQEVPHL